MFFEMVKETDLVSNIKDSLVLSDIIGGKVKLINSGKYLKGLCPFHNEKTPSFVVYDEKGYYHCYGCGAHGDIINFVMNIEKLSFVESIEILKEKAGIRNITYTQGTKKTDDFAKKYFEMMEITCDLYNHNLVKNANKKELDYINNRKIKEEDIKKFKLGLSLEKDIVTNYLVKKGFSKEDILKSGISKIKNNNLYDFFKNRLMFPICDKRGRVAGFGGRTLDGENPKYINSSENEYFKKRLILYNFNNAKHLTNKKNILLIVEGYTDVMALDKIAIPAVSPMGTAITIEQIKLAWEICDEPVICFDGDDAGFKAIERTIDIVLEALNPGKSVNFIVLGADEDPDGVLGKENGESKMLTYLENKDTLIDIIWKIESSKSPNNTPERLLGLKNRLKKRVDCINNIELKDAYKTFLEYKMKESYEDVFNARTFRNSNLYDLNKDRSFSDHLRNSDSNRFVLLRERAIVGAMINNYELLVRNDELFGIIPITNKDLSSIREALLGILSKKSVSSSDNVKNELINKGLDKIIRKHFNTKDCKNFSFIEAYAKEAIDNQNRWYSRRNKY